MIKCYTLKSTFTNADKCKKKKKKCYFMYIYISLSSGQTVTTDFMVYGNKGLAREDWEDVSGRGRKDIFM